MNIEDFFKNKEICTNENATFKTVRQIDKEESETVKIDENFFKHNLEIEVMEKLINYIRYVILKEDEDNSLNLLKNYKVIKNIYLLWAYEFELTSGGYYEFFNNRLYLGSDDANEKYIESTIEALISITEDKLSRSLKNAYMEYKNGNEDYDKYDEEFYSSEVRFRNKLSAYVNKNKEKIIMEAGD